MNDEQRIALRAKLDELPFDELRILGKTVESKLSDQGLTVNCRGKSATVITEKILTAFDKAAELGVELDVSGHLEDLSKPLVTRQRVEEYAAENGIELDDTEPAEVVELEEDVVEDEIIILRCHPSSLGATRGDVIINPKDVLKSGYMFQRVTRDKARQWIASGRGILRKHLSKTPDRELS